LSLRRLILGLLVVVTALVVAVIALRWEPRVPQYAGTTLRAVATLTDEPGPDPPESVDPATLTPFPAAGECLERIVADGGYLDLCWSAQREMNDADPRQDYYHLEVYGTFGPGTAASPRWAVVRLRLPEAPASRVFEGWPTGAYEGDCAEREITGIMLPVSPPVHVRTLCGQTVGDMDPANWTHTVTWTCNGCLLPDARDRAIALYSGIAVPQGTLPSWQLHADIG
jgi:hypothetical protein